MHICMCVYHVRVCVCAHVCMRVCVCECISVWLGTYGMCVYMFVSVYTHCMPVGVPGLIMC